MSNYESQYRQSNLSNNRDRSFRSLDDSFTNNDPYRQDSYDLDAEGSWRDSRPARHEQDYRREGRANDPYANRSGAYGLDSRPNRSPYGRLSSELSSPQIFRDEERYGQREYLHQGGGFVQGEHHPDYLQPGLRDRYLDNVNDYDNAPSHDDYRDYTAVSSPQSNERASNYAGGRPGYQQRRFTQSAGNLRTSYGESNYRDQPHPGDRGFHSEDYSGGGWYSLNEGQQSYRGRAPKGYERSDERVREDICEQLSRDHHIDASEIIVTVKAGVATLEGTTADRRQKHRAEDIADACSGVKDVQNRINVLRQASNGFNEAGAINSPQRGYQATGENRETGSKENTTKDVSQKDPTTTNVTRQ
ncbi:MAG: hypothetical protein JWM78_915 [Verrucomicrobiaceae bacterium]|nr:hypothetical protein [Verrucomicrobiaceae bacterium]